MNDHPSGPKAPKGVNIRSVLVELGQLQLDDMMSSTIINMIVNLPRDKNNAVHILQAVLLGVTMSITKPNREEEFLDGLVVDTKNKIAQIKTLLAAAGAQKEN